MINNSVIANMIATPKPHMHLLFSYLVWLCSLLNEIVSVNQYLILQLCSRFSEGGNLN